MYDIGTVVKMYPNGNDMADPVLTALIVGYSFTDKEPKHVVLWHNNAPINGEFGLSFLTTREIAKIVQPPYGICDMTAFIKMSKSLDPILERVIKKETELEEDLDALRHMEDSIISQTSEIKE